MTIHCNRALGRGNNKDKGYEVGVWLVGLKNSMSVHRTLILLAVIRYCVKEAFCGSVTLRASG